MQSKALLRQQTIQALTAMPADQRQVASADLYRQLFALPAWQAAKRIATTISGDFELATQPIIDGARAAGKTIAVPVTLPHRQMAFHVVDDQTTFATSSFGLQEPVNGAIIEPDEFDLIIVPGLRFATTGERLGFGGGYYDRYLPRTNGFKVALALPAQQAQQPTWPVEDFDVLLDAVLAAPVQ
ncbi:5-formyltetrahydrofolate cyclo-ligase [Levilactobacillus wangkuiensis]|uniref:5-formyltetrahydrofolate cyclo-ligase n=1 Tax=Levilactobacillus wangkuiensis TaxID=2799566 RepID=UPI00194392EC|nr:5-formyltetrahydrofolate cyclo-ligase [Levilactobacillus wangkuiensis]